MLEMIRTFYPGNAHGSFVVDNLNTIPASCPFSCASTAVGAPNSIHDWNGFQISDEDDSAVAYQIAFSVDSADRLERRKAGSAWGAWALIPASQIGTGSTNVDAVLQDIATFMSEDSEDFYQLSRACVMPIPTVTSPAADATGVSTTPTIATKEGVSSLYSLYVRETSTQTGVGVGSDLIFNHASDADIPLDTSTGIFTLPAGYEFRMGASPNLTAFSAVTAYAYFDWVLASDNSVITNGQSGSIFPATYTTSNAGSQPHARAVLRTTEETQVKLRITTGSGTCDFSHQNSWAEISSSTSRYIDYTHTHVQVQIRLKSSGAAVYSSGDVSGLDVTVSPALSAATQYEMRVRHKHTEGFYTRWSEWQTFTTA